MGVCKEMENMQKIIKVNPEEKNDVISKCQLFGWKIISKEKLREMTGINTYEDTVKLVIERDEAIESYDELLALEKEYDELVEKNTHTKSLLYTKQHESLPKKPEWKYWTKDRGYGSYLVYYGDYSPVSFWNIVFLVPPITPIGLILLIVKLSKNKKSKIKFQEDLDKYNTAQEKHNGELESITKQNDTEENRIEEIIARANEIKG